MPNLRDLLILFFIVVSIIFPNGYVNAFTWLMAQELSETKIRDAITRQLEYLISRADKH